MTLEEAKRQIKSYPKAVFNKEQKQLMINILQKASPVEIDDWFQFLNQRVKFGFNFDYVPKNPQGTISLVQEEESLNINTETKVTNDENKLIIGENFDALKNLLLTHKQKINIIYIDPPYNTEATKGEGNHLARSDNEQNTNKSKFVYWDKFSRTGWLNLMYERLKLAKQLLANDGIIFVSIDDTEQAYLKVLMDQIFGENNFLNQINWVSNRSGRQITAKPFVPTYEYILVYAKSETNTWQNQLDKDFLRKVMPDVYKVKDGELKRDSRGNFYVGSDLTNAGVSAFNVRTRCNLRYPLFVNEETQEIFTSNNHDLSLKKIWPGGGENTGHVWRWQQSKVVQDKCELFVQKNNNGKITIHTKDRRKTFRVKDLILSSSITTKSGYSEIKSLELDFNHPKPTLLLEILFANYKSKEKIWILDFFAGSGTTAHTVLKMNKKDQGKRQFILVTNNEKNIGQKICYQRLHRIIKGNGSDFYPQTKLRVFSLKKHKVALGTNIEDLGPNATKQLQKLNPDFQANNEDIYWKLASLIQD